MGCDTNTGVAGLPETPGESCTLQTNDDGYTIICPNAEPVTIPSNGAAQGEPGASGEDGTNGMHAQPCSAVDNQDSTFTIDCPNFEPIIVTSGTDGEQGPQGEPGIDGEDGENGADGNNGQSCSVVANEDGTATITCPDGSSVVINDGVDGQDQ